MSNTKKMRLSVLGKVKNHVETASQCGITQTKIAKTELELAFRGSIALIGDLVETIDQLEQKIATLEGGSHD